MTQIEVRDPRTYAIIGAAMEVHGQLGQGFLEAVYTSAMAIEFANRGISFRREAEIPVKYKGHVLPVVYRADFLCFDSIIVEIKALTRLSAIEDAQTINYLKATGSEVGLLINFGEKSLVHKRFVSTQSAKSAESAVSL